nr:MAG TPA: hypothetical protein [Caudoviricetes sp.]
MDKTKILPTILIVIQICAAVPYGLSGNWRQMVYWIAAAVLNAAVTY